MTETSASSAPASSTSAASSTEAFIYRNLTIKPFVKQTEQNETTVRWGKYKMDVERQFRFFGITDTELKKDGLLIYGGEDLIDSTRPTNARKRRCLQDLNTQDRQTVPI